MAPFEEMRRILFDKTGEKKSGFGWKGAELANQLIRQAGYDGIIADLFSPGNSEQYIIFNPEQVLLITKNPSSNPDIRYSLKDSKGNELSEQQAEFFKDSKVGMNGNLKFIGNADFHV